MDLPWRLPVFVGMAALLASCVMPPPYQPGRPGRSLDRPPPPRYGEDPNRYFDPVGPPPGQYPPDAQGPGPGPSTQVNPDGLTPPPPMTVTPPSSGVNSGATVTTPPPTTAVPPPETPTTPPPPTTNKAELPYGRPVPGKKGFVYSPYDPSAGPVSVEGIAPNTKVKCPFTGKVFRVP